MNVRTRPSGFTLMEMIVAIILLSVAVPPMLIAVRQTQTNRTDPIMASRARWLASEKLEDILADRHSTTRGYSWVLTSNYAAETPVTGYTNFSRSVAVNETAADLVTAGTGYKKVTVSVTWRDSRGISRTLAIATELTDY